jgi:DNA-binding MarR family transcriptional regulator
VTLTPKGRGLVSKLIPVVERIDEDFFSILDRSEKNELIELLNKVVWKTKE